MSLLGVDQVLDQLLPATRTFLGQLDELIDECRSARRMVIARAPERVQHRLLELTGRDSSRASVPLRSPIAGQAALVSRLAVAILPQRMSWRSIGSFLHSMRPPPRNAA